MDYPTFLQNLNKIVEDLPGWCVIEKAHCLAMAVLTLRPKVVVEIGVFGGRSLLPMALAMKHANLAGKIIAIDPWSAAASVEGQLPADAEYWKILDHEQIFEVFNRALLQNGVDYLVEVRRKRSDETSAPPPIDLLHIDGNHGMAAAMYDAEHYGIDGVRVGGLCYVDDIGWSTGGPGKALELLKDNGFIELYGVGTGSMLQRVAKQPKYLGKHT